MNTNCTVWGLGLKVRNDPSMDVDQDQANSMYSGYQKLDMNDRDL